MGRAVILNYHYISPAANGARVALRGVTAKNFALQARALSERYDPLEIRALPTLIDWHSTRTQCLVTFDDGDRRVFSEALPHLLRHGVSALIFCCSEPYLERRVLNVQKIHLLQGVWGWGGFEDKFNAALGALGLARTPANPPPPGLERMYRYDSDDTARFKHMLNVELPLAVTRRVLDLLFEAEFGPQADMVKHLYLLPDELKRCADLGFPIGVHTHSHCMLSRLSRDEQARELDLPLQYFRDELKLEVAGLSYPYGIRGSWNENTKQLAALRGIRFGMSLGRCIHDSAAAADRYEIPRYDVNDVFADGAMKPEFYDETA